MKDDKGHIDKLSKRNIHQVPDGYFEDLPMRIQQRVTAESSPASTEWKIKYTWTMSAAAILLIIGLVWWLPFQNHQTPDLLADVSSEDIIDYLSYEELSMYELSENFEEDERLFESGDAYLQALDDELSDEDLESIYLEVDFSTDVL